MRMILTLVFAAAIAWSGYWYIGKTSVNAGFESWFEERRSEGWVAEFASLEVRGFPNRFDTTFTDVALADPNSGLAWDTPFFQLLSLSYQPNHVIAIWPQEQRIATPYQKFDLISEDMRASLVIEAKPDFPLQRATITANDLRVTPHGTQDVTAIDSMVFAIERSPADDDPSYRLGLTAEDYAPSAPWLEIVDPDGALPEKLEKISADLTVRFDKAWDRTAIELVRPQPQHIDIRLVDARWGQLQLQVAGKLDVGRDGVPEGELAVKARNWREILQLSVAAGTLNESFAEVLESGLDVVAQLAGNPKTLDIPLNFSNGFVKLGPVPLGPAPVLRLR